MIEEMRAARELAFIFWCFETVLRGVHAARFGGITQQCGDWLNDLGGE